MKIELRYFTGTGNSWKVLETCNNIFNRKGHQSKILKIDLNEEQINADLIGFAFPVHGFGIPRIARQYLSALKKFDEGQKVFFILTSADSNGSGLSSKNLEIILKRKNGRLIYSDVIQMPNNWIPFTNILTMEENLSIIQSGIERSKHIAQDILNNKIRIYDYRKQPWFFKTISNFINIIFRNFGLSRMKSMFRVYDSCNGCGICAKACPTGSIKIVNGKPKWSKTCEQCMRCVHVCPRESIYQTMGGHTKTKNRYIEPDFKPLED
ncbi:MAG: EFR1 family ferrodoxin [Candidatus Marinimicrobia bacterium]|nr:EFR1 family ferrodoxin [Candidatus Neomarinimicrobiota bacterium]